MEFGEDGVGVNAGGAADGGEGVMVYTVAVGRASVGTPGALVKSQMPPATVRAITPRRIARHPHWTKLGGIIFSSAIFSLYANGIAVQVGGLGYTATLSPPSQMVQVVHHGRIQGCLDITGV